jgi:hypothetical protein
MIFDPFGVHDVDSKESDLTWLIRPLRGRRKGVSFLARMIFDPFGVHDVDSKGVIPYKPSRSTLMTPKESYPIHLHDKITLHRPQRGRIFPLQIYHWFLNISPLQFLPIFPEFLYPKYLLDCFPFCKFNHECIEIADMFC